MASRKAILSIVRMFAGLYPTFAEKRTSRQWEDLANGWEAILADIPDPLFAVAALECASTVDGAGRSFFPSPAQIRDAAAQIHARSQKIPTPDDAWAEVLRAAKNGLYNRHDGWYTRRAATESDWSHPLVARAIEGIGGLAHLRTSDNLTADRARFLSAYTQYRTREHADRYSLPCVEDAICALRTSHGDGSAIPLPDIVRQILGNAENKPLQLTPNRDILS